MDEFFTPEQKKFLSTPEGKKILEIALERASSEDVPEDPDNFQERETDFIRDALKMQTDSGGAQPMTVNPEFVPDTMDSVNPSIKDSEMPPPGTQAMDPNMMPPLGTQAMDPNMTFEEMEHRKMLAQLMANQQTRTA